jgi:hypothetical protein
MCNVESNGYLTQCEQSTPQSLLTNSAINDMKISSGYAYILSRIDMLAYYVYSCKINDKNGVLSECNSTLTTSPKTINGIAVQAGISYSLNKDSVINCTVADNGMFNNCHPLQTGNINSMLNLAGLKFSSPTIFNGDLYILKPNHFTKLAMS